MALSSVIEHTNRTAQKPSEGCLKSQSFLPETDGTYRGRKKSGAKKKKSWDSVVNGAQGKGVRNPKAYAAKVFRAQGIDPRTGKKTKKKK